MEPLKKKVDARLSANPDDQWALARHAELLLDEGRRTEALVALRRAYELDREAHGTRMLLVQTLLSALEEDFASNRQIAEEVEGLIDQTDQHMQYLRLMAEGLQNIGQAKESFDMYLKLAGLQDASQTIVEQAPVEFIDIDAEHRCRLDRWIQTRLTALVADAKDADRDAINEAIVERGEQVLATGTTEALRRFVNHFGSHPVADAVRLKLATRLAKSGDWLEREMLLQRLVNSADEPTAATAQASLAQLYLDVGRLDEAGHAYALLRERWSTFECLPGKTGAELYAEAEENETLLPHLELTPWPAGEVVVDNSGDRVDSSKSYRGIYHIATESATGPLADGGRVYYDQGRYSVIVRNGDGQEVATVSIQNKSRTRMYTANTGITYAKLHGHMLFLSIGYELMAIDLLRAREDREEGILWRQDLTPSIPGASVTTSQIQQRQIPNPWGPSQMLATDASRMRIAATGPLNDSGICYQQLQQLICKDPLTGDVIWTRDGVEQGSEIFGDEELLFVVPPRDAEAQVFSVLDGRHLGTRPVTPLERRWETLGRNVLDWEQEGSTQTLRLIDAWTQEPIWQQEFAAGSKGWIVENDEVAVMQPDGTFIVRSLETDQIRVSASLGEEPQLQRVFVFRSPEQYILIARGEVPSNSDISIQAAPGGYFSDVVTGNVYAFDRSTGKPQWQTSAYIDKHGLPLDQPPHAPVLTFIRHMTPTSRRGNRQVHTSVLCLDKRDGRVVLSNDDIPSQTYTYSIEANRVERNVTINLPGKTFVLQFTDNPVPPAPPAQTDLTAIGGESALGKTVTSLLRAFTAGAQEASQQQSTEQEIRDLFGQ